MITIKVKKKFVNKKYPECILEMRESFLDAVADGAIPHTIIEEGELYSVLTNIKNEFMDIESVGYALQLGGDVEGLQAFIKLDDVSVEVTEGIPNRTTNSDDGVETVKTWAEWASGTVHEGTDGKFYIESSNGNRYYTARELAPVYSKLVSVADFNLAVTEE
jgi:hypothetical protein